MTNALPEAQDLLSLVESETPPSEDELRNAVAGHLCRCTGYQGILRAIGRLSD